MESGQLDREVTTVELKETRHVLGLSGGKDSAALATHLKDQGRNKDIEYFFCDTGAELREIHDFLDRLVDYLGRPIERLSSRRDFNHHLKRFNNFLTAPHARWCTRVMKREPRRSSLGMTREWAISAYAQTNSAAVTSATNLTLRHDIRS